MDLCLFVLHVLHNFNCKFGIYKVLSLILHYYAYQHKVVLFYLGSVLL